MEMIEMWVIQKYCGERDGKLWFTWKWLPVPKDKEPYISRMNDIIPKLFRLPGDVREAIIGYIVLMYNNNGINQYFPYLKDYTTNKISQFVDMATSFDGVTSGYSKGVK